MNRVLVVGDSGREHSLAWKLHQSPSVDEVICAPGNPGMADIGECLAVHANDPMAVAELADRVDASLVVVGPEAPLVAGVCDAVRASGRLAFGPSAEAAKLEGSKAWMKDVLLSAGVPTARHATFGADELDAALAYLEDSQGLWVVKTDGLAAGKGVAVSDSLGEARASLKRYLSGEAFGDAGRTCVIEERMTGPEISLFVLCDGTNAVPMVCAQDHKRVGDGDTGLNTGGMGAYSPVPFANDALVRELMARAIDPTLEELRAREVEFRGVLYCGVMLTPSGPKILEYNVRFGDPECEILMRRMSSDLYVHLLESAQGSLHTPIEFCDDAAVAVCLAADGYPATPIRGDVISGVDAANALPDVVVFHAGTQRNNGELLTNGGRVLVVTATGATIDEAQIKAYEGVDAISWPGMHYRTDIGAQAVVHGDHAPLHPMSPE